MSGRRWIARLAAGCAAVLAAGGLGSAEPPGTIGTPSCGAPLALSVIDAALDRSAARIDAAQPLTIVTMGSSSTKGTGASSPAMSYPSRLEAELRDRFPQVAIRVLNRGIGGEDVGQELARFGQDIFAFKPDLVIWQVGTNAVLRHAEFVDDEQSIRRGVAALQERGIDVILMDLQYAPRVLARPAWSEMERILNETAQRARVGLFRRFEIMQEWDHIQQLAPMAMIGPDGLHMTDASYGCLARQLAAALARNWRLHGRPPTMAGLASHGNARPTTAPQAR
jgi:lysophospholipase L1-like esterase